MSCPSCEASPAFHGRTVHLWSPQAHTQNKLERALGTTWSVDAAPDDLYLHLSDVDHGQVADTLAEILTERERRDCRVLVTAGETVTADHIPSVLDVDSYITTVHGAWLDDILSENRLGFAFQPIVDVDLRVHGHEALVRAQRRDGTPVSPADLFAAAGTPSLLATLDREARLTAVTQMPTMPDGTRMFINFMPSTIYDPDCCLQSTAQAVKEQGVAPGSVVFEVVESDKARDRKHLKSIFDFYRAYGYGTALDDFGTGYNNLNTLLVDQPDYIKIDKAIMGWLSEDSMSRRLVSDLVRQASNEGTIVIAEGVETETDFTICADLGIPFFQGFYFAKPASGFFSDADLATGRTPI